MVDPKFKTNGIFHFCQLFFGAEKIKKEHPEWDLILYLPVPTFA